MLSLEKNVYEKQISQARSKYIVQINKQQVMKDKLIKKEESMNQDEEDYRRETKALAEYEEHFKSKLEQLEKELEDIGALEVYLNNSNQKIELTVNEKRACLEGQNSLKQERHSLSIKLQNQQDDLDSKKEGIIQAEN